MNLLCADADVVGIRHQVMGCKDVRDDPVLETVVAGKADMIVTLDRRILKLPHHVAEYMSKKGVKIVKPDAFCALMRSDKLKV